MTTNRAYDEILDLWEELTEGAQVDLMTELYFKMRDAQKDRFLEETENA